MNNTTYVKITPFALVKYGFFFTIGTWAAKAVAGAIIVAKGKHAAKKAAHVVMAGVKEGINKVDWTDELNKIIVDLKEKGIDIDIQEDPEKFIVNIEKK